MISQSRAVGADVQGTALPGARRWALGLALAVMTLSLLPYMLGFGRQGQDWRFTGFVFGVEDGNSYIAKMQSGAAGAWLFRTPYTPYPQNGVVAYLPYLLLGKLAAMPGLHEQLVVLFHLFRIAAGCLAILASYDFISYFVIDERLRRYGLLLVTLGGGLGWILLVIGRSTWLGWLPLEYFSPETFGFLQLYGIPHLALARAAMLWGLLIYLKATSPGAHTGWKPASQTGLLWLLVAICQPMTAVIMGGLIGLHLLVLAGRNVYLRRHSETADWSIWRNQLIFTLKAAMIPAPLILYSLLAFSLDPFLKAWTAQNRIISPPIGHYLLAYGLMLVFVPLGARRLLRRQPASGWLLVAWVVAAPFLAYAPLNLQRRLVEGVWVALVILGLWSVNVDGQGGVRWRTFLYTTLLIFPSTLILFGGGLLAGLRPSVPLFRPVQETRAFEELAAKSAPGDVVVSSYATGNALPAWAPLRVVIGHGPESAGLENLLPAVQRFYTETTPDSERLQMIRELNIRYVFYGPAEAELGDWNPAQAGYLQEIIRQGPYIVYEVQPGWARGSGKSEFLFY
jgi:hypothetical protein